MIVIQCHECKRKYNWAGDAFCPHCGAFNQAEDYGFDREPLVVELEEPESGPISRAPDRKTSSGNRPKIGCLQKVIIAFIVWNVFVGVIAVAIQSIAEVF